LITPLIAQDFSPPDARISLGRQIPIAAVAVPKTSVNKQCDFVVHPNEVRLADNLYVATPTSNVMLPQ
jgi:hypothetical protein